MFRKLGYSMPTIDTKELISISDAGKAGISALVKAAENGEKRVLMRNSKPVAAVVGIDALERAEELEERLLDVSLALTRLMTASERRHSLDDVLDRFGFTRDELEAG
jgi:antitoxin (DNA-binding transcriptional repressor) of toxin-antitoxin stability system